MTLRSPELCIKVARPNRCRTLAGEAWVYERLAEGVHQGANVPRCYGFFATELGLEQLPCPVWLDDNYYEGANFEDIESDDPTQADDTHLHDQESQSGTRVSVGGMAS